MLTLAKPSARLLGLHVNRHDAATAHLRLAIALDGVGTVPPHPELGHAAHCPGKAGISAPLYGVASP
ncbi:hypothetical protein C9F11_45755 (plasmid) [Streptomyces sp. YIM 121038]|nr:hypothetical protein C9F11_45755 [Streptomyces sp. YIM 121038]